MDQNSPTPSAQNPKQQVIELLKGATNVLVTVSANPSVDQLAACIGLTLMMNKLDKHATAVFSGQIPSTLEFLQPEKTLETNTDSLRDFIISLDRSKADKLRYKIEDNVVKIFITPYRTSLSESDLQYSQGDFNVDVVVALGVDQREHIDAAIVAHGRILHDAAVIGVSYGQATTDVGSINWHEPAASSLSEMLVSISEAFQSGILDTQMATAFLTGIVAETERFSNDKTSPKVMTMSAQLMAAGANQQLIAAQLNPPQEVPVPITGAAAQETPVTQSNTEDKTEFEVPQAGEEGEASSNLISLHEEEKKDGLRELKEPAPAVDLGFPGQQSEDAFGRIHIDNTGRLHDSSETLAQLEDAMGSKQPSELTEETVPEQPPAEATVPEQAPEQKKQPKSDVVPPVPMMRGHEKVIKPLDKPEEDLSAEPKKSDYIFEPPTQGGTFTGSTDDDASGEDVPSGDASQTNPVPLLSHNHEDQESPAAPTLGLATDPVASSVPVAPSPVAEPPVPVEEPPVIAPDADADSARKAVMDAMSSIDYQPVKPDPISALNAQPISLDAPLQDGVAPMTGMPAPPPVPPPLPTQAPLPDPTGDLTLPVPQQNLVPPQDPNVLPPQQ